jgi:hypothetical protein
VSTEDLANFFEERLQPNTQYLQDVYSQEQEESAFA